MLSYKSGSLKTVCAARRLTLDISRWAFSQTTFAPIRKFMNAPHHYDEPLVYPALGMSATYVTPSQHAKINECTDTHGTCVLHPLILIFQPFLRR